MSAARALPSEQTELELDERPAAPLPTVSPLLDPPVRPRRRSTRKAKVSR